MIAQRVVGEGMPETEHSVIRGARYQASKWKDVALNAVYDSDLGIGTDWLADMLLRRQYS